MSLRLLIVPILLLTPVITSRIAMWQAKPIEDQVRIGLLDPASPDAIVFVSRKQDGSGHGYIGIRFFACPLPATIGNAADDQRKMPPTEEVEEGRFIAVDSAFDLTWYTSFDEKRPIRLRWSTADSGTVLAQLTAPPSLLVGIELYQPFDTYHRRVSDSLHTGFLVHPDRRSVLGELIDTGVQAARHRYFLLRSDRTPYKASSYLDGVSFRRSLTRSAEATREAGQPSTSSYRQAALIFDFVRESQVSFTAVIGDQWDTIEQRSRSLLKPPVGDQIGESLKEERQRRFSGSGAIGQTIDRLRHFLDYNRFFNPLGAGEYLVSRNRSAKPGGMTVREPAIDGDTLLLAGLSAPFAPATAVSTFREVLSGQLTDGRIPLTRQLGGTPTVAAGRSMMPLGSLAAMKIYLATGDLELLAWAFPRLRLWNEWWLNSRPDGQPWRDGDRDGLPEWGYNEDLELGSLGRLQLSTIARRRMALAEAGTTGDGQSDIAFNEQTSTLELNSITLGSLLALDTECLALIARELGLTNEAELLNQRHLRLRALINARLWDEDDGIYVDRRWSGQPLRRLAPGNFLPLAAGLPGPEMKKRVLSAYRRFSESASIPDQDSSAVNYLLYFGLRRYGLFPEAANLARALARHAENRGGAETLHRWALIDEVFTLDPLTGLNVGTPETTAESRIEGLEVGGSRLDIVHGPKGTIIRRNGRVELECDAAVGVGAYRQQASALSFTVVAKREVRLLIPGAAGRKVTVSVDGNIIGSTSVGVTASFSVPAGTHRVLAVR